MSAGLNAPPSAAADGGNPLFARKGDAFTSALLETASSRKRNERALVRGLSLFSDALAIIVSYLAAGYFWLGSPLHPHVQQSLTIVLPMFVFSASNIGAYSIDSILRVFGGMVRVVASFLVTLSMISLTIFMLRLGTEFSRAVFLFGAIAAVFLLPVGRLVVYRTAYVILKGVIRSTLVIVDGVPYTPLDQTVITVTPDQLGFDPETNDPFHFHQLARSVADFDRVLVACPEYRYAAWSSVLKGMAIDGEILADEKDEIGIIGMGTHGDRSTLVVVAGPLHLRERILKRALDIVLAGAALLVLSPLLLAIAIAIRFESRGPALFSQDRIGQHNKIFRLYKFRSMFTDKCDADAVQLTQRDDPRVTRVGEFIRRTSIDELPQLFNVLKGEMSLVGPRPHAISAKAADQLYWDVDPRYRHRHSMKPGLTGLAQVRGYRGATDRTEDLVNRLSSDLEYVAKWSVLEDIRIILRTLAVLRHDNAF